MKLIFAAFFIMITAFVHSDLFAASDGIVVWRLDTKTGVSEKDIDSISGFVTAEVERHSGRKVISEADIATILKGEEIKQNCTGESDTGCIAEIGNALGVPEAVSGDLGRMGDYWILNLRRINVSNAEVIARSGRQIKGDINALIEATPSSVADLFGVTMQNTSYDGKAYRIAGWSLFGAGAGLLTLGGVGHFLMNEANGENRSDFDTWKAVSITGYAVGGAALLTGISLLIYDAVNSGGDGDGDGQWFSCSVLPAPGAFSAELVLKW